MAHVIYNPDRPWDKLIWGLILIGLGVAFLLSMFGFIPGHWFGNWWPAFVVAAGLGSVLCARSPRAIGSAVTTLGMGGWLMVAANDWFGLGWMRSWPLALVAAGFGYLAQALAQSVWPRAEGDDVH